MGEGADPFAVGLEKGEPAESMGWDPAGVGAVEGVVTLAWLRHLSF